MGLPVDGDFEHGFGANDCFHNGTLLTVNRSGLSARRLHYPAV